MPIVIFSRRVPVPRRFVKFGTEKSFSSLTMATSTLPLGLSLVVATLQGPKANNMNGDYPLSATPGADKSGSKFPKRFSDYPGDVEFFDVYSPPIRSTYGEVFWTLLDPVPLPQSIVAKYAGKGMAVVGFETNQVRRMATGEEVDYDGKAYTLY